GECWRILQPALPFLLVLAFTLFLQLPAAAPFYEWVPGAAYIQFPWRLLALITPSLIVAAVYLADKALPGDARNFLLGGASVWMVVACGAFVPPNFPRISLDFQLPNLRLSSGAHEYEPRQAQPVDETREKVSARWKEAGCSFDTINPGNVEVSTAQFRTSCGGSVVLPLPLYASRAHVVTTSSDRIGRRCLLLPDFPGVCSAVIPAAEGTVSVKLPNVASLAGSIWRP